MAQQLNGPAIVPHSTYNEFRQYCLTHGVNFDYIFGNQCVDTPKLLWYQYGLTLETGNGYAYGCWTQRRAHNSRSPFISIYNKSEVKRGDCLVFNRHGSYNAGHICFADEDYHGGSRIRVLGQNQGQGTGKGKASNVINYSWSYFLGAFRNTKWSSTPPTPPTPPPPGPQPGPSPTSDFGKKFPWFIYTNRIRNK